MARQEEPPQGRQIQTAQRAEHDVKHPGLEQDHGDQAAVREDEGALRVLAAILHEQTNEQAEDELGRQRLLVSQLLPLDIGI